MARGKNGKQDILSTEMPMWWRLCWAKTSSFEPGTRCLSPIRVEVTQSLSRHYSLPKSVLSGARTSHWISYTDVDTLNVVLKPARHRKFYVIRFGDAWWNIQSHTAVFLEPDSCAFFQVCSFYNLGFCAPCVSSAMLQLSAWVFVCM